jgi:hypothetical protein
VIAHDFYLTDRPDAFDRLAAPACGPERLALSIAGMDVELCGLDAAQLAVARREYGTVLAGAPSSRPLLFAMRAAPPGWFRTPDLRGTEYRIALSHDAGGAWLSGQSFVARLTRGAVPRMALWVEPSRLAAFEGALVNALRLLVAHALHAHGGLVLHSAAIESAGRAFVFFGPSGVGKTTLSRLSAAQGRSVISDELNALVRTANGFAVLALPFAGDFGRTPIRRAPVPLAGLFRLRQGPSHALGQLSQASAIAALIAACPYINADPLAGATLMSRALELADSCPPAQLWFALDHGFWRLVQPEFPV